MILSFLVACGTAQGDLERAPEPVAFSIEIPS